MSFLKVWTELDDGTFKSLPAKVISERDGSVFVIRYLSSTDKRTITGKKIYKYENETYEITNESITQFADSELDLGFENRGDYFIKYDSVSDDDSEDEDYVPSSESESESEDDEWSSVEEE